MTKNQILVTPQGNGKVTKAFAKQASIFGTTEFKQWREFLSEFPNAKMIIKTPKKNSNRKTYSMWYVFIILPLQMKINNLIFPYYLL